MSPRGSNGSYCSPTPWLLLTVIVPAVGYASLLLLLLSPLVERWWRRLRPDERVS